MTQENKDLLLKDLCARLPYGVMVEDRNGVHILTAGNTEFTDLLYGNGCNIKPYLRPMSSMTEEEKLEREKLRVEVTENLLVDRLVDFYNSHHLDWRGLILFNLALKAPEDMYI